MRRAGSDVRKSGPIGPVDHLVAARQSVGSGRSVRHVTRYNLLPFMFLLLFSLMTITHTALTPPLRPSSISRILHLFTLAADLGDLAAGPDAARRPDVSFLRVRIALTTFARREQRRTSRRYSDLSSLPGRGHDYDLLTWTTVSESGHRGVRRWISAFSRSQIEGMEVAKSRLFLSLAFAMRRKCLSHSLPQKRSTRIKHKKSSLTICILTDF